MVIAERGAYVYSVRSRRSILFKGVWKKLELRYLRQKRKSGEEGKTRGRGKIKRLQSWILPRKQSANHEPVFRAVTRTLIDEREGYILVLLDRFLFKLINLNLIWKETCRAEHEYMNIHPPQLSLFSPRPYRYYLLTIWLHSSYEKNGFRLFLSIFPSERSTSNKTCNLYQWSTQPHEQQ